MSVSVTQALKQRVSIRAFLPMPVPGEEIRRIFQVAQLSPSNCNVQPWQVYVASGEARRLLQERLVADILAGKVPTPDFEWGMAYEGEMRQRQFGAANALYGALGIDRKDHNARAQAALRNWMFFDAPHAVFFTMDKSVGMRGAVDLGIYAQTLALLMTEAGIASCMQGALNQYPAPVREVLDIPPQLSILFGMSFGYADLDAPVNTARTVREPLENAVRFFD